MRCTPKQFDAFKDIVRGFANTNKLECKFRIRAGNDIVTDVVDVEFLDFTLLEDGATVTRKSYTIIFGEVHSLTEATACMFADVYISFGRYTCGRPTVSLTHTIKDVIFNPPATIVFWSDNTKTVVRAQDDDSYDPEKGLAMAISKKMLGNKYDYYHTFLRYQKKWDAQMGKIKEECQI